MAGVATAALPNANVKGSPARWSPTKLTVTPRNFTRCTARKIVWTITNKTARTQTIEVKTGTAPRKTLGSLSAGQRVGVCAKGPAGSRAIFIIKGSRSRLAVTLA